MRDELAHLKERLLCLEDRYRSLQSRLESSRAVIAEYEDSLLRSKANAGEGEHLWLEPKDVIVKLGCKSPGWLAKKRRSGQVPRWAWRQLNKRVFLYARSWVESYQVPRR